MGAFTAVAQTLGQAGQDFFAGRELAREDALKQQEMLHKVSEDFFRRQIQQAELANATRGLDLQERAQALSQRWQDVESWRAVGSPVRDAKGQWVQEYRNLLTGATRTFNLPGTPETAPEKKWEDYQAIINRMAQTRGVTSDKLSDLDRNMAYRSVFGSEPATRPRTDAQELEDLFTMAQNGLNNPLTAPMWKQVLGSKSPLKWAQEQWLIRNAGYGIRAAMPAMPGWIRGGTPTIDESKLTAEEKIRLAAYKSQLSAITSQMSMTFDPAVQAQLGIQQQGVIAQMTQLAEAAKARTSGVRGGSISLLQADQVPVGSVISIPPDMPANFWSTVPVNRTVDAKDDSGKVIARYRKLANGQAQRVQ